MSGEPLQNRFQILSLDGGGLKGVFTAAFLAEWERTTGQRAWKSFDLIAGTSTGGIIALALGLGHAACDILEFYLENGRSIFPSEALELIGEARQAMGSRYSPGKLEQKLDDFFGDAELGDSRTRLLIPAYHADVGDIYIFKTAHDSRLRVDYLERMAVVARATGAAPTYFSPVALEPGLRLIDGGVWANNPVLLAVTEAIGVLQQPVQTVAALRVGTTWEARSSQDYPSDPGGAGFRQVGLFTDIMMRGQMLSASGGVGHLLGADRFVDINPVVPAGRYRLDRLADELAGLGRSEFRKWSSDLGEKGFLDYRGAAFEPFYRNEEDDCRGQRKTASS